MTDKNQSSVVRQALPSDAEAIARVHVSSWLYAYAELLPESVLKSQSVAKRSSFWGEFITNSDHWPVYILEKGNDVIGFSSVIPARDKDVDSSVVSELAAIYLDESAKDKGLGGTLLMRCWDESRSRGCTSMVLWVLENNNRALNFYQKHGFVADGKSIYEEWLSATEIRMKVKIPENVS